MADSILKLRVESSEYDAKLKKAAEGIRHLADVAHQSGGELTGLEQSELEYIRALGEMETKSRTAAGQSRELANAYKEMKVIYDQLNDVEKADEGGKALAASLEQIKQRAQDAKKSLDDASSSLNSNEQASKEDSSSISDLTSKLGINIKSLAGWGAALGAGKIALQVLGDSFMSNETNVDDWGRTMQASESLYNGFVTTLNNGDFTGFVNGINTIVSAAKDAYNALDELGTRMTIINPERAKLQARQTELRATIREKGVNSEEGKAAQKELKQMQGQLTSSFNKESQMNYNAFQALVKQRLAEGGINLNKKSFDLLMKSFSDDNTYQALRRSAKGELSTKFVNYQNNGTSTIASAGQYQTVDTRNTNQKLMDLFTDEWRKKNSGYLTAAFSAQGSAASNRLGNARYTRETTTGGGKGGSHSGAVTTKQTETELQQNQKKVNDLQQQYVDIASKGVSIDDARLVKLREEIDLLNKRNEQLKFYAENAQGRLLPRNLGTDTTGISQIPGGGVVPIAQSLKTDFKIDEKSLRKVQKSIEKQADEQIKQDSKDTKSVADGVGMLSNGMTSFAKGLDALGIDLGEGFDSVISGIMAVTSILSGISTILIAIEAIAGADAIIPLAHGGIVPHAAGGYMIGGNSFSGDNIFAGGAWVNSGELVLNKSQQSTLASRLNDGGITNIKLSAVVRGNQLLLVQNNDSRISGKGTIMRTNSKH